MAEYKFPVKAMVKTLRLEWNAAGLIDHMHGCGFGPDDELRRIIYMHADCIDLLSTYEEIDSYLQEYRGMTLQEWVDSL